MVFRGYRNFDQISFFIHFGLVRLLLFTGVSRIDLFLIHIIFIFFEHESPHLFVEKRYLLCQLIFKRFFMIVHFIELIPQVIQLNLFLTYLSPILLYFLPALQESLPKFDQKIHGLLFIRVNVAFKVIQLLLCNDIQFQRSPFHSLCQFRFNQVLTDSVSSPNIFLILLHF